MTDNYLKYRQEITESDIALRDNQNVFHKAVFNSDDKIIIAFPAYPNFDNHLCVIFGNGSKTDKYLISLTNNKYHEILIGILLQHNFGNSKIAQLGIFNKIQEVISEYYIDIKERKYFYSESSKNSFLYCFSIPTSPNLTPRINVCVIDEDKLIESFTRRIAKRTEKDLLNFSDSNFIYLMQNKETGFYKIGFSKTPVYRERTLHSKEPSVVLHKKWMASQKYESKLKEQFKAKRTRGEWYSLDNNDLKEIDSVMSKFYSSKEDAIIGGTSKLLELIFKHSKPRNHSSTNA